MRQLCSTELRALRAIAFKTSEVLITQIVRNLVFLGRCFAANDPLSGEESFRHHRVIRRQLSVRYLGSVSIHIVRFAKAELADYERPEHTTTAPEICKSTALERNQAMNTSVSRRITADDHGDSQQSDPRNRQQSTQVINLA
jgi:hypothetical protein